MPLYSTEAQTKAWGKKENGSDMISDLDIKVCAESKNVKSWCYMFVHYRKVDMVRSTLEKKKYPVFIHKSIIYKRESNRIKQYERPTISGLVFVQGDSNEIQTFLKDSFFNLHLVKDCSSGEIAIIPDSIMQSFIRVSEINPTRIRFMPHAIDYYSEGNPLIRITSGILSGLEGYRIRISRDKCLVTTIGGMTIAIGGIYKESFENLDEYVRMRRENLKITGKSSYSIFTPLQQEIDGCFFTPQNQLDVMAIAEGLSSWVIRMKTDMVKKNFDEAVEIALFLLEETGSHFLKTYHDDRIGDVKDIMNVCREADNVLTAVVDCRDVSSDLKEIVETGRESLVVRYPFLPIA